MIGKESTNLFTTKHTKSTKKSENETLHGCIHSADIAVDPESDLRAPQFHVRRPLSLELVSAAGEILEFDLRALRALRGRSQA